MRVLLDTHIFLWLATDDRNANKKLRAQVESASDVYVSAASVWEVAIKSALGKLDGDPGSFHHAIDAFGFHELAKTACTRSPSRASRRYTKTRLTDCYSRKR